MGTRRLKASELGIDDVDLTAAAATKYASNTLDVRNGFLFTAIIDITETGTPAAGDAKLTIRSVDSGGTTLYEVDAVTAIDTQTSGNQVVFTWGVGSSGTLTGDTGTIGSNLGVLQVFEYMQLVIEVTTQNDGTTSTADVQLLIEEV